MVCDPSQVIVTTGGYPVGHRVFGMVKQLESNATGVATENGEINPSFRFLRSERQRKTGPNMSVLGALRDIIVQARVSGAFINVAIGFEPIRNDTATPVPSASEGRSPQVGWLTHACLLVRSFTVATH